MTHFHLQGRRRRRRARGGQRLGVVVAPGHQPDADPQPRKQREHAAGSGEHHPPVAEDLKVHTALLR